MKQFMRNFGLNVLFMLTVPLVLSVFTQSTWMPWPYALAYAYLETIYDHQCAGRIYTYKIHFHRYLTTLAINVAIFFGVSVIINIFVIYGILVTIALILCFIALMSMYETKVDRRMYG